MGEKMTDPTLQALIDLLADKDARERNKLITALTFAVSSDEPEMRRIAANIKWRSVDKAKGILAA